MRNRQLILRNGSKHGTISILRNDSVYSAISILSYRFRHGICQHEELELEHGSAFPLKELLAWNTTPYFNFLKKEIMYLGWMEHILSEIELSVKWHRCPVDTGISMNTYVASGKRQWRNANTGRSTYLEECPAWDRGVS